MKHLFASLLLIAFTLAAIAQKVKKVTHTPDDRYYPDKEVFYVLKENDNVRHGHYQQYVMDDVEFSGWYKMGKKDSTWRHFGRGAKIFSTRFYSNGMRTGTWEFNDRQGNPEWKYNFNTGQAMYTDSTMASRVPSPVVDSYLDDNGAWVKDKVDKKPVSLAGSNEWLSFLVVNLRYPKASIDANQQGKIWITIIINEKGEVTGFEKENGPTPALSEEGLRVCSLYPFEFLPAEKNGHPVAVKIKQPLVFRLENH